MGLASSPWTRMPLGDFVTLQRGHDLPEEQRRPGRVPILGSFGVTGWHDEPKSRGPGVTVGRSGASFGVVNFTPSDYWPLNTALYVVNFHGNDERFAYYFLKSMDFRSYNSGSAQPSLNRNHIHPVPVDVPPVAEQRAIARFLGALDDKIGINHRMSETLEVSARTLFNSWFVDFDPVRAKFESRDLGFSQALADQFPASFEDSLLGSIPKGWSIKAIGDLADVAGGSTPSTQEPAYWDGGMHHWATPKDLSAVTVPILLETERRITDAGLSQIGTGLLPVGTVLLSSRAPIGYLAIAEIPVAINQGFIAMRAKKGVSNLFLLLWASAAKEAILSRANGSTFLEISKSSFRPIPVVVPGALVMQAFDRLARPLYERIVVCERETRALAAVRDTLLPRLVSGELRVTPVRHATGGLVS
ncbi:MAG TPA: restriction endonuclease subunit S [Gemmatimonadales bacterium]